MTGTRVLSRRLLALGPRVCRRVSRIDGRTSSFPPQSAWQSPRSSRQSTLYRAVYATSSVPSPASSASLHLTSVVARALFPSRFSPRPSARFQGTLLRHLSGQCSRLVRSGTVLRQASGTRLRLGILCREETVSGG